MLPPSECWEYRPYTYMKMESNNLTEFISAQFVCSMLHFFSQYGQWDIENICPQSEAGNCLTIDQIWHDWDHVLT